MNLARAYSALLITAIVLGVVGLVLSLVMFVARELCEPLLPVLLPVVTKVLFRSALYYSPGQYYWIAGYIGVLSAGWTVGMVVALRRRPAENRRIDAALKERLGPQYARGAPLDP